jgi:2'-5' RNA ligase
MTQDYRIFAGAFPTGELSERIQAVRQRYDPVTARITPPHVTLAGTYWRSGPAIPKNEAASIARLEAAAASLAAFELHLEGVFTFPPPEKPVIYMGMAVDEALLSTRRVLLQALGQDKHQKYTPHLTLAMRLTGNTAQQALSELKAGPLDRERFIAPIQEIRLMQRGPADPAWRCIAAVGLKTKH